ncbi:MAG: CDP-alcohol phosphatidyltransferase family protein [Planctomycetaceae bacterium]|nr:CDP-alcohol phosphatidyltransferase family protein [Planctomycetales bacterium]MCB9926314.1 CDP-alcohol phosphatidyltransferase family protein [Planctomycetaceae bacterium]
MSDYQPTSRRPIAQAFRRTATWCVNLCVRFKVHPDTVSYSSVFAAAIAGLSFWQGYDKPWLLIMGVAWCGVRLWLNMLDGMVALASGQASLRGEIVNELPDRLSDILIFVGVAHSGLCYVVCGYWAAMMALCTAYVGTLAQAVGARRQFGGVMSKPWRMAVVMLGACVVAVQLISGRGVQRILSLTVMDWTCCVIVLGCIQTIGVRLLRLLREVRDIESSR